MLICQYFAVQKLSKTYFFLPGTAVPLVGYNIQVHLKKLNMVKKVIFSCKLFISKSETFIYFRFITCKGKTLQKLF